MRVKIYMKSGNVLSMRGVKEMDFKYQGDNITSINVKYNWLRRKVPGLYNKVSVASINLSQVEAISGYF